MRVWCAVLVLCSLLSSAWADSPVYFSDTNLKAAVEEELWISDPTPMEMLRLTQLMASSREIGDLAGLEHARNLQELQLPFNRIPDISVVSVLTNLHTLVLNNNQIADISPVAGLTGLRKLDVHNNLLDDISPVAGLVNLHTLYLRINQISDLSPLSGLTHLETLVLRNNQITDITPLSSLTELRYLQLAYNQISDISPLSALTNLESLYLNDNRICDISALAGLTNLETLYLNYNQVSDISPLVGLTSMKRLHIRDNPLSASAYDVYIPMIMSNNPGIHIQYEFRLGLSSTTGGSVVRPGEGEFRYKEGEVVQVQAEAEGGYVFAFWSGAISSEMNPLTITMDTGYDIRANFVSSLEMIHVDDSADGDAGSGDSAISDLQENGTPGHPFDSIQEAIDVASDGASVLVHPGTYREKIDFLGKSIQLVGIDPNDPNRACLPVIDGGGTGPVVTFSGGEGPDCLLMGFAITRGRDPWAAAVRCRNGSPTIAHCLIVGNRATFLNGSVIHCQNSDPVFVNCTIANNAGGGESGALVAENSNVIVTNSIVWGNRPREVWLDGASEAVITYSDVAGGWPGLGNIDADPLFAGPGHWGNEQDPNIAVEPNSPNALWQDGDYYLQSQAGRWDCEMQAWVQDDLTSPCIDAGDPAIPAGSEPIPNGATVNIGAYGGTVHAGKSLQGH